MPRYLFQAAYTSTAAAAFIAKPQDRTAGLKALAQQFGGSLESFDYCFGDYDTAGILNLPDDTTALAASLAIAAAGHLKAYKTTRLYSPDEFLAAQQKARGITYQPPKA